MAARITLYDSSTAVEIRVATTASAEVRAQAEQLRDDLNAFVAAGDPFSVVSSDSTTGDHIRVELESSWSAGELPTGSCSALQPASCTCGPARRRG